MESTKKLWIVSVRVDDDTDQFLKDEGKGNRNTGAANLFERARVAKVAASADPNSDILAELEALEDLARNLTRRIVELRRRLSKPSDNGGAQ